MQFVAKQDIFQIYLRSRKYFDFFQVVVSFGVSETLKSSL